MRGGGIGGDSEEAGGESGDEGGDERGNGDERGGEGRVDAQREYLLNLLRGHEAGYGRGQRPAASAG
jgi:hypothetical protein